MQNNENTTFLSFLRLLFSLEWTKKWFKAFFETYIRGEGGEFVKTKKSQINENFEKCPKISNEIWSQM